MNQRLKDAFRAELAKAQLNYESGALIEAFSHLENAHVLGQQHFIYHMQIHIWMLRIGWVRRDFREIRGQLLRLVLTPLGHLTGRLPLGNTGGANVSAFKSMPIADEMKAFFTSKNT